MPSLAVVVLVPFAPRLAARFGTVPVMVAGAALVALSFALMPVLEGVGWWLLLRLLSGVGLTLPWLVGETWINTVVTDRVRGRVLGLYAMLLFSGWAVGPLLVDALGTTGPAPFVLGRGRDGAVRAAARARPPAGARRARTTAGSRCRRPCALAPLAMLAAAVGGVAEFGYISLLPAYAVEAGASTTTSLRLLTVLLVGGICLQVLVGWLADHVDRRRLLAALGVVLAVGAAGFAALVGRGGLRRLRRGLRPGRGGRRLLRRRAHHARRARRRPAQLVVANAGFLVAYEVGATVGPVLGGAAMDLWRPHGLAPSLVAVVGARASPRLGAAPAAAAAQPTNTQNGWPAGSA